MAVVHLADEHLRPEEARLSSLLRQEFTDSALDERARAINVPDGMMGSEWKALRPEDRPLILVYVVPRGQETFVALGNDILAPARCSRLSRSLRRSFVTVGLYVVWSLWDSRVDRESVICHAYFDHLFGLGRRLVDEAVGWTPAEFERKLEGLLPIEGVGRTEREAVVLHALSVAMRQPPKSVA